MRGDPPKQNYLPEGGPLVVQASPACWVFQEPTCVSAAAGVVRGCIWLQCIFFEDSTCLPIAWWVIYEHTCPHCTECSAVFEQNQHDPVPHPPYSPSLAPSNFCLFVCVPWWESPQGEVFCQCGRGETKNGRITKRHQNWLLVQKLFWAVGKKSLLGVLHQMESTLKVIEV